VVTAPSTNDVALVLVPCFSGAAWDLTSLPMLASRKAVALTLPEGLDSVDDYADFLAE
jgi:hypothetical protein